MVCRSPLLVPLVALTLAGCSEHAPSYYAFTVAAYLSEGTTVSDTGETAELTTGSPPGSTASSEPQSTSEGASSTDAATGGEAGSTTASDAELLQPRILAVDMPAKVSLAGPVAVQVTTEGATLVRGTLDGVELALFEDQGGGVWAGTVPIFGAADNGEHVLEVTATNGPLAALWPPVSFTVKTPAPGGLAWGATGPSGSTTKRIAVTAQGDVIEVGVVEVAGVLKPSIRKRSGANGSELWPEGTIVLDEREGSADAVAVLPDGRMWAALNVKNANKTWQPRIVLLDADGHETGVEVVTEPGPTVRGIAVDDEGGAFAVGFAGSGFGDMDVVFWWMRHDSVTVHSAKTWDYVPIIDGVPMLHKFDDLAFDVIVKDGIAWIAGASTGWHDKNEPSTRGVVVQIDVEAGLPIVPVIVASPVNTWRESIFLAIGAHPDGVIVTGSELKLDGSAQQITVQAYRADGARTYYKAEFAGPVAYGTGVAWTTHGVALVSGVVQNGDVLCGLVYGRGGLGANFDHYFPGTEPSAANGLARTTYDQVIVAGERTLAGVRHARAARIHQ